jgi:hypothetical protein
MTTDQMANILMTLLILYADGSAGVSYNSNLGDNPNNNYFLGVAYHHFNRPNASFYRTANIELFPKWVFSGGIRFGVSDYGLYYPPADQSMQGAYKKPSRVACMG